MDHSPRQNDQLSQAPLRKRFVDTYIFPLLIPFLAIGQAFRLLRGKNLDF